MLKNYYLCSLSEQKKYTQRHTVNCKTINNAFETLLTAVNKIWQLRAHWAFVSKRKHWGDEDAEKSVKMSFKKILYVYVAILPCPTNEKEVILF